MAHVRKHWFPVLLLVALCLSGALTLAAKAGEGLEQARTHVQRHNYKSALAILDKLVTSEKGSRLRAAQRLKIIAMCRLRDQKGYEYAKKIMADHKPFTKDPVLWEAMGDVRQRHWPRKDAYNAYLTSAKLWEKRGKLTHAADVYIKAVQMLRRDYNILPKPQQIAPKNWDWQKRREVQIDKIIEHCEHVAAMKIDDNRKANALYLAAQNAVQMGDWKTVEKGIALHRRIVKEFGKLKQAGQAQYDIGQTFQRFGKFTEAVAEYQKVFENFPRHERAKDARKRVEEIKAPRIRLGVTKPYLPGEKAQVYWEIRNLRKLHLTARKVDLPSAVDKVDYLAHLLGQLATQAKGAKIEASWAFATPDKGKHQFHQNRPLSGEAKQTTLPIEPALKKAGAYLVAATGTNPDGKSATAYCLVVLSEISVLAKADRDQTLVFVTEASKGTPINEANVSLVNQWTRRNRKYVADHVTGKTNDAGLADLKTPSRRSGNWVVAVRKGDQQALTSRSGRYWGWWGWPYQYKVYGFTERPVYRPGHTVHFKQIVRSHKDGVYHNTPNTKVRVTITNPKGQSVYAKDLITDKYGAVEGQYALPSGEKAPLGIWRISVQVKKWRAHSYYAPGNQFRVEEYRKPEFKVAVEGARSDYRVGDDMKIKISARYYYGQPVVGAEVKFDIRKQDYHHGHRWPRPWQWYYDYVRTGHYGWRGYGRRRPWWIPWPRLNEHVTSGTIKTDKNGEAFVSLKAAPFKGHEKEDIKFLVKAEVTDASRRVIRGAGEVKVTHAPFFIYPRPAENVYSPGDKVKIEIKTEDPNSKPVAGRFSVEAWRIERVRQADGKLKEKLAQKVFTGKVEVPATGRADIRFTPDMTGHFKVIVKQLGVKKDQKPVEGSCYVWVASRTGAEAHYAYNDLQIVPAKDQYEIGETLKVLVNTGKPGSYVLLTGEADDILFRRIVHVKKNSTLVEVPVDKKLCPNFSLQAVMLRDNKLFRDVKNIVVPPTHRFLKVEVEVGKGSRGGGEDLKFQPREKTKIRVRLTDMHTGKPVTGQVVLMLVDSSVYYIQPEFRQAIEKAFYGHVRRVMVATTNSFAGPGWLSPINWGYRRYGRGWGRPGEAQMELANGIGFARGAAPPPTTAMPMVRKSAAKGGPPDAPALAKAVVRKHFRDTVLWAGSVVADADGVAQVPVTLPDQLTTFALHAIAFDTDTRVGQSRSDVITTKRIIVRLQSGRFFTEGDHSYVTVIAHNYYKKAHDVVVDLKAMGADSEAGRGLLKLRKVKIGGKTWQEYKAGDELKVTIPGGGEARLDFLTTAQRPGDIKLLARARSTVESDAIQLTRPIVPWGAAKLIANGGVLRAKDAKPQAAQTATWTVMLPRKIRENSQSLVVTLNPSIAAVAMESLPYLARYPYGCVEQTMSRFLPTVLMRKTMQDAGVNLSDVRNLIEQRSGVDAKHAARYKFLRRRMGRNPIYSDAEVAKMIAAGVKRLKDMQRGDGGWGWWKRDASNPHMTAYVLSGLVVARECDVKLPAGMIERAAGWLAKQAAKPKPADYSGYNWWYRHVDNDNTRAYMLYAVGRAKPAALKEKRLARELQRLFKARDDMSDYGRALLAIALHDGAKGKQAKIVVENFENTVTIDKKTGDAHWGRARGWWYWYHGGVETTAWVVQAMLSVSPDDKHVPKAVQWLVHNRRELHWYNTKATAMAVYALARYAKVAGEVDCDQTYVVKVDDAQRFTVRVTKENLFTFDSHVVVPADQLTPGKHTITVTRKGKGNLYWGAYVRYFDLSDRIEAAGSKVAVARKYFRLVPEKFQNTRRVWKGGKHVDEKFPDTRFKKEPLDFGAEIASGEMVEVRMTITADDNLEYMIFEDPKPAGCEPYRLVSGSSYGGGVYANMELRDTKVVFFATWVPRGKRDLSYRLVCEQPGTFRVLPSAAEAMYTPWVEAISDSGKLTITEKPRK